MHPGKVSSVGVRGSGQVETMWPDPPGVAWLPGEPSILWPELRALGPITAPFSGVLDRHPEGGHQGGSYGKGHVGSGRREGNREMWGAGRPGGRTRGLPVAWPWSPSHVQWSAVSSPVWAAQGKQTGVRGRGGPRQRLLSCSPELPPLPLHAGGQPPALRGALCSPPHSTSCLPPVWHPVWGLPGARSPVSSSCLSPDCELQWLVDSSDSREYLLPPRHPPRRSPPHSKCRDPDGQVQRLVHVLQELRVEGPLGDDGRQPGRERQQLCGPVSRGGRGG